jgi:hypothetical protein
MDLIASQLCHSDPCLISPEIHVHECLPRSTPEVQQETAQKELHLEAAVSANLLVQLSKFLSGFQRFQKTYFSENKDLYHVLQHGQAPKSVLIGCCDSRVDPAVLYT